MTGVLGAIGVVWGIVGGLQMIWLAGVYAIIGIVVRSCARGIRTCGGPTEQTVPYGRAGAAPLVIAIKGFVLVATLLYAGVEAVFVIVAGGSDTTAGWGVAYGVLTTVGP